MTSLYAVLYTVYRVRVSSSPKSFSALPLLFSLLFPSFHTSVSISPLPLPLLTALPVYDVIPLLVSSSDVLAEGIVSKAEQGKVLFKMGYFCQWLEIVANFYAAAISRPALHGETGQLVWVGGWVGGCGCGVGVRACMGMVWCVCVCLHVVWCVYVCVCVCMCLVHILCVWSATKTGTQTDRQRDVLYRSFSLSQSNSEVDKYYQLVIFRH